MDYSAIPKTYDPKVAEPLWEEYWLKSDVYDAVYKIKNDGRPWFVIDTPPPFTSGSLHIGQGYWITLADVITRYRRMRGFDVLIPQGWDTHGLPTELKVEKQYKVPRSNKALFEQMCIEWTQRMIAEMKKDMIRLGYRPDWERFEYCTLSKEYLRAVQLSLLELFEKGLVYVGTFPVLWCPNDSTAIAQAETGYKEEEGWLYTVRFEVEKGNSVAIATTRPELIPACQAIVVNPDDERYTQLVGKLARVPYTDRWVTIIKDEEVDRTFGTGAVMVCSYGDEADIKWIKRHSLPETQVIDEKGRFTQPDFIIGKTFREARLTMVNKLREEGLLQEERRIKHKILIHAERSDCQAPLEFINKKQVLIRTKELLSTVLQSAESITFYPDFMKNKLKDWIASIEWDWIISRQRVFGTPLPFYHCRSCDALIPVPKERFPFDPRKDEPPFSSCPKCGADKPEPITDVCDGWIDSSITPLFISGYYADGALFEKAYPVDLRLQGQDIIRTWLFYTLFRCKTITGRAPFKSALVHGWVLDVEGKKMTKSRGSLPVSQTVEQFGADSLRYSLLTFSVGSDFGYTAEFVRRGKLFMQKIWSAYRFAAPHLKVSDKTNSAIPIDNWIIQRLSVALEKLTKAFDSYEFNDGLSAFYEFFWHELCDEYLEAIKYRLSEKHDEDACRTLSKVMWVSLRMLAPVMPHLAEEIYQKYFRENLLGSSIHGFDWPSSGELEFSDRAARLGGKIVTVIKEARRAKVASGTPLGQRVNKLTLSLPKEFEEVIGSEDVIRATLRADVVEFRNDSHELKVTLI